MHKRLNIEKIKQKILIGIKIFEKGLKKVNLYLEIILYKYFSNKSLRNIVNYSID